MKIVKILIALAILATSLSAVAVDISKTFTPSAGVKAVIEIKGSNLVWKLSRREGVKHGEVDLETENIPSIEIGSYDFSGRLGFLVSHLDDGMGTYEVDRVFTFSPSANEFVERFPSCGDGFVNLRVDKKRRRLISTYWDQNIPKLCATRLSIEK